MVSGLLMVALTNMENARKKKFGDKDDMYLFGVCGVLDACRTSTRKCPVDTGYTGLEDKEEIFDGGRDLRVTGK